MDNDDFRNGTSQINVIYIIRGDWNQCSAFDSDIYLIKGHRKADAKDIVDLITLSLHPADKILLITKGSDTKVAGEKVFGLLN